MALVPVGKVTVRPATATISVNITGGDVTAYTSQAASATHTLPKSITTNTDFWLGVGQYLVTCSMAGVTIDSQLITIQPGSAPTIDPAVDSFTETASVLAQYAALTGSTFTGELVAPDFKATGQGAGGFVNAGRYLGTANAAGFPTTGTFVAGDWGIDSSSRTIICATGGTPGQWVFAGGTLIASQKTTAAQGSITGNVDITGCTITFTAPAQTVRIELTGHGIANDTVGDGWQFWMVENGTIVGPVFRNPVVDAVNQGEMGMISYLATGLTYGSSYTYKGQIGRLTGGTVSISAEVAPLYATQIAAFAC